MSVKEYFEAIASEHRMVQHSDTKPHFASSLDEAATLEARRLHYPAIFLQGGDFFFVLQQAEGKLLQR